MKKLVLIILLFTSMPMLFAQNKSDSLYEAVEKGDTAAIKDFVKNGADVNFIKQQGWVKVNLLDQYL